MLFLIVPPRSATCTLQVNNDLTPRLGAANQQGAVGWSFERLWLVADVAGNQPAFAGVTNPRPARPPHRNITGLGEFEQALERRIPVNDEATASERDQRPCAGRSGRRVWWEARRVHHARCAGCIRTEKPCLERGIESVSACAKENLHFWRAISRPARSPLPLTSDRA
jgi:hypothetical protein